MNANARTSNLKVLNLSGADEVGGRFNGFDVAQSLERYGVDSRVGSFWEKSSASDTSFEVFPGELMKLKAEFTKGISAIAAREGLAHGWSRKILEVPEFTLADVVHLQVVHDGFLSLKTIREIFGTKPAVWTWHDFWPLTGHCISPVKCPRWEGGCGKCPDLTAPMPVVIDRTRQERSRKANVLSSTPLNIHVSTNWMAERVEKKIESWNAKLYVFPFGIDTTAFTNKGKEAARKQLGIGQDDFVIYARQTRDPGKQFNAVLEAVEEISLKHPNVLLLTIQEQGMVAKHSTRVRSLEFPWTNDRGNLIALLSSADLFAMPSTVETFGMMALEAMACSVPVVACSNSATAEVVDLKQLEVKEDSLVGDLVKVFSWSIQNSQKLCQLGIGSRERVNSLFSEEVYLENLARMYFEVFRNHESR